MTNKGDVIVVLIAALIITWLLWSSWFCFKAIHDFKTKVYLVKEDVYEWARNDGGYHYEANTIEGRIKRLEKLQEDYTKLEEYLDIEIKEENEQPAKRYYKKGRTPGVVFDTGPGGGAGAYW